MSELQPEMYSNERCDYGRLWPDGTFNRFGSHYSEFSSYDFVSNSLRAIRKDVPPALRPVLGQQRVVTTTETYPAEACQEPTE